MAMMHIIITTVCICNGDNMQFKMMKHGITAAF